MNRDQPTNSTVYPHGTFRRLAIAMFLGGSVGFLGFALNLGFWPTTGLVFAVVAVLSLAFRALESLDRYWTAKLVEVLKFAVLVACIAPTLMMEI